MGRTNEVDAHHRALGALRRNADGSAWRQARAVAWMLVNAAGGLADGIADGSISRRRGVTLWVRVARRAIAGLRDDDRAAR